MLHYIFNSDLLPLFFVKTRKWTRVISHTLVKLQIIVKVSKFHIKWSYNVSFQNVLYDWFIDWLFVAECPLCKCKSLGPLNLILGNPYGDLKKTTYNFELKLHENKGNNNITELRTILQRESQNSYVYKQTKSVNNRKTVKTVMTLTWYRHF